MKAIDFVVRTGMGAIQKGEVPANKTNASVQVEPGSEISLHIRQFDVSAYQRSGSDLNVVLADGRVITLENYFEADNARLFISAGGFLNEVTLVEGDGGALYAQYGPTEEWGKWSPAEELIFVDDGHVIGPDYAGTTGDDEVSMLGAGLLGGSGLLGAGAAGAAALGGAALIGGGGNGGDGGSYIPPTVDGGNTVITDNDEEIIIVTGTGEPDSEVEVSIGGQVLTTHANGDGRWEVTFEGENFPEDGEYQVFVHLVEPDGAEFDLDGPNIIIDTTPPELEFTDGTQGSGHIVNAEDHADGVDIFGTSEPGAEIVVEVAGHTRTVTVGDSGEWTVSFTSEEIATGEYETEIRVTATDGYGNSQVYTDMLVVDTVPHEIVIDTASIEGDGVVNATEAADGVTITGTSFPGATLTVTVQGMTQTTIVGEDGSWSVDFSTLEPGEYDVDVTAQTVDVAGNPSSVTESFRVDTIGSVSIDGGTGGADGIVSQAEANGGLTLTGSAEPGSTVSVQMGEYTRQASVAADGSWTVTFSALEIPQGTGSVAVVATATDGAGNITTAESAVAYDTEAAVSIETASVEGDGIINGAERADGVTLTGQSEPGSSVLVTMGTATVTATVAANGSWSATFPATAVPTGETSVNVSATATDAAGNSSTATGSIPVDTLVTPLGINGGIGGTDGIVNAAEADAGLVLTGQVEPGSSVVVSLGGISRQATVDATGTWTATYNSAEVPRGDRPVDLVATATDAAGNVESVTSSVTVDTEANSLTLNAPVTADNTINLTEARDGVILSGTSEPGAIVTVEFGSGSRTVVTDGAGNWQAGFTYAEVPADTSAATITATTTDTAGNTSTATGTVAVDTVVDNFASTGTPGGADGVVNADEASGGVIMSGTVEPGSSVSLVISGQTIVASVDGLGNWTAGIPASLLPSGEDTLTVTVNATDAVGNTASVTDSIDVDTLVNRLTLDGDITGDNVINASEGAAGVTLTGQVEAGSSVMVDFDGTEVAASVDAAGNWSVTVPPSAIRAGQEYDAAIVVTAMDAAGNTDSVTGAVTVDALAPESPVITSYTRETTGYSAISVETSGDDLTVYEVHSNGTTSQVGGDGTEFFGNTMFGFDPNIPEGSHLVVDGTDAAGNTSGTYLVLDETTSSTVDLANPNLSVHEIESLDLRFAEESSLTIDEATITALSSNSDTLTIHGGSDDQVTITGAVQSATGAPAGYDAYSVGDATVYIDEDIQISTPII